MADVVRYAVANGSDTRVSATTPLPVTGYLGGAAVSDTNPMPVRGKIISPSANFTRPADTTAYTLADLVANSTTAGSVVPLSWAVGTSVDGMVRRVRLQTSSTSTTNASFRLHLYSSSPVPVNGDNAAWSTPVAGYLGSVDVTIDKAFSDGARGEGVPNTGAEVNLTDVSTVYGLLEARAAYTPTSAGVFTVVLETHIY